MMEETKSLPMPQEDVRADETGETLREATDILPRNDGESEEEYRERFLRGQNEKFRAVHAWLYEETKGQDLPGKAPGANLLAEARGAVLAERRNPVGEDFWAIRCPTASGLAKAARNILCAPFNLASLPWMLAAHMRQKRFWTAVENGELKDAVEALDAGADLHADRGRAFLTAVYRDDVDMVRQLHARGADQDMHKGLPLVLATIQRSSSMVACLLDEAGASLKTSVFTEGALEGDEIRAILKADAKVMRNNVWFTRRAFEQRIPLDALGSTLVESHVFHLRKKEMMRGKIALVSGVPLYLDLREKADADSLACQTPASLIRNPDNHCRPQYMCR